MKGFSLENQFTATFEHPRQLHVAAAVLIGLTLCLAVWGAVSDRLGAMPLDATAFMLAWLVLSLVVVTVLPRWSFGVAFLVSLLCMMAGWRIAGLYDADLVTYPLIAAFAVYLVMFFAIAWRSVHHKDSRLRLDRTDWHETLIRIYIGFDLIPHFTEKLFAGAGPRGEDIKSFTELGLPEPEFFVILGGLCELGIAIGIGLGLLTRLAACCSALYFLIATVLGHHFYQGFIWASPGGGWEYPVLMIVLLISFVLDGAGPFSVDNAILRRFKVPSWLRPLMVPKTV